jgi:eukaryotic-like serine/threonine-protein kinase
MLKYDRPDRGRAALQFWRQHRTAGVGRRRREPVRTADDQTEELDATAATVREKPADAVGGMRLVLGRYRLMRRLGAGGFGVVWLAHDERLDRVVAVKRIAVHDAAAGTRAQREAKAAARLSHPGIVQLYESGRDANAVYLVSELVRGRTLGELMEEGELSDRDVLLIGIALCDALKHAHGRGVVHRDVKPGNVMVPDRPADGAGVAKLTDFGVARIAGDDVLTRTGDVVGTLAYMAPEQAEGRDAGAEADLYALALVLYEALAGVNPVRGRGAASTARRVGARLPPLGRLRRDLALDVCAAIDRAVQPRPEHRGTLEDLRAGRALALPTAGDETGTIEAGPLEGVGEHVVPRARVRPVARLLAGAAAGALATAAVAWLGPRAPVPVPAAGAAAALVVAVLPRVGWLVLATAIAAWLAGDGRTGVAVIVVAAAAPAALLLRRSGAFWSAPAVAPMLGVAGLAGAWPALAGQAARPWHRLCLGALGAWWLVLAEAIANDRLALGPPHGAADWQPTVARAWDEVLVPLATNGALLVAGLWAIAALVLPFLVRGRFFAVDLVAATAWAAALGSATQAVAPGMRGLVAGAVAAGGLAVAARAMRPLPPSEAQSRSPS